MDEQRRNEIIARSYALLERRHEQPAHEPAPEPKSWAPRHVERSQPAPRRIARTSTDSSLARQLDHMREQLAQHIAADRRDKAGFANMIDALADESGAECGRLQRQVSEQRAEIAELQSQLNAMRAEIALLRGLQPKRLLARRSTQTQIEGSLASHPVN